MAAVLRALALYMIIFSYLGAEVAGSRGSKKSRISKDLENSIISQRDRRNNCPKDRPFVDCVISPCKAERLLGRSCEPYPQARCVNQLCGGCVAKHFINNKEIHCGKDMNVICELQNSSLSCPINHIMSIKQANYGRTDPYTCRHSYNFDAMHSNTNCLSSNATQIVRQVCEGRTACWPDVSSKVFGDPCHGIYKYLKVEFDCISIHDYFSQQVPEMLDGNMPPASNRDDSISASWTNLSASLLLLLSSTCLM